MPSPGQYFDNKREKDLAERVWKLADTLPGHWPLHSTHATIARLKLPWVSSKIIYARDWITCQREADDRGGVVTVNKQFKTDFNADEIADVEHFYVAALIGTLGGPTGGVMLNASGCTVWEMFVGPLRIAWSKGVRFVPKNVKYNFKQLTGPDWAGTRFGALFTISDALKAIN